jgi:hypothetical protein
MSRYVNTSKCSIAYLTVSLANGTEICGNIYNWVVHYTSAPTVGGAGCYRTPTDPNSDSLIKAATYTFTSSGMTRDVCVSGCAAKGTKWAGVYNGNT